MSLENLLAMRRLAKHEADADAVWTLPLTLGLEQDTVLVLDKLRKQRNLADYSGDTVSDAALAECRRQAEALLKLVIGRVRERWPDRGDSS